MLDINEILSFLREPLEQFPDRSAKWLLANIDNLQGLAEEAALMQSMAEHYLAQGIEQGIEQGETRAKQVALLKLLQHRFQNVPEAVTTQIYALRSPVHLDTLFEQVLTAENLEDIDWQVPEA